MKSSGHKYYGRRQMVERFTKLVAFLKRGSVHGQRLNASTLAVEFETSERTIHRDLDFLRDFLQMPIAYDRHKRKWVIEKVRKLPWFWL